MGKTYGYARISRPQQNIERQIRNIKSEYPDAVIVQEAYTGTKMDRPRWNNLIRHVKPGDTIIFDSVSRMARNAEEGFRTYQRLYDSGVNLVFLKEPMVNTSTYKQAVQSNSISMTGTDVDVILDGVNKYLMILAREQIRIAFDQAEKEVADLHQRTREGIETARLAGKQIGQKKGAKLNTKKSASSKQLIKKCSISFGGNLTDVECMKLTGVSRNTFYKYKHEIRNDMATE